MNYITSLSPLSNPSTIYPTAPLTMPNNNMYYAYRTISGIPVVNSVIDADDVTRVKFPREDLLKFSSQEYDDYIKNISLKRPLTEREHKVSKKQRRLIKNREYAQISRNKKKSEYSQLSSQIDQLNQYNSELNDRVNQLESENKRLKEENLKLMEYSSNSLPLPTPSSDPDSFLSSPLSDTPPLSQSPPLTPPSSEDSSSFDLFSEDYTDNLFSPDWSSLTSKYTFMAIFCCLLLFIPFSSNTYPVIPQSTPIQYDSVPAQISEKNIPFSGNRRILNKPEENSAFCFGASTWNYTTKGFITIDDVLNDELNLLALENDKGISLGSIKERRENDTMAGRFVISNKIHYLRNK